LQHNDSYDAPETDRLLAAAAKALLGYFVWWDILHTTSSGVEPLLGVKHDHLLDCGAVDIGNLTGCDNAVLKCICQITDLGVWKAEAEAAGVLSVYELVQRGATIQQELDNAAASHLSLTVGTPPINGVVTGGLDTHKEKLLYISSAFRHAAGLYLHVLVSGPNPRLPEIQKAVGETRIQLQHLIDVEMLGYAAWPLCVAACLAPVENQEGFESLLPRASDETRFRSAMQALEVARKCWALRDEGKTDVCWRIAIRSLDRSVLLA
jgi:hypothetical protein